MEYATAYGSCLTDWIQGLVSTLGGQSAKESLRDYHTESCKNGLYTKTIACIAQVDKMCEYSVLPPAVLTGAIALLCDRKDDIFGIQKCSLDVKGFVECAKTVAIDANNPICSATAALKKCLGVLVRPCGTKLEKLTEDAVAQMSAGQCDDSGKQNDGTCAFLPYLASVATCFSQFGARMPDVIKNNKNNGVTGLVRELCRNDDLSKALLCHQKVDERCDVSLMDARKIKLIWKVVCANDVSAIQDLKNLPKCYKLKEYKSFVTCMTDVTKTTSSVCRLMKQVRPCYTSMYSNCGSGVRSVLNKAYDLAVPSVCDKTISNTECSATAYMVGMAVCWAPSIVGLVKKFAPRLDIGVTSCGSDVLERGRVCHQNLDSVCKASFVRADGVKKILGPICEDKEVIQRFAPCLQGKNEVIKNCAAGVDLMKTPVDNQKQLCRLVLQVNECALKPFRGDKCNASVTNLMTNVVTTVTPQQCLSGSAAEIRQTTPLLAAFLVVPFLTSFF